MTWIQILAQMGVMATFIGAGLALAAFFNGKHIKSGVGEIRNLINTIEKSSEQRHQEMTEWFKKSDEHAEKRHSEVLQQHNDIIEILHKRGIKKLMVEGGSTVISNFLKQGLVDDFFIYVGPMIIGGKDTPSLIKGELDNNLKFKLVESTKIGPGVLLHYRLIQ